MGLSFIRFRSVELKLIDEAVIDCRLRGLYMLLCTQKYVKFQKVVNDTIRNFQNAEEITVDPKLMDRFLNIMYMSLIDMAMGRQDKVHDMIRNLHYEIRKPWLGEPFPN